MAKKTVPVVLFRNRIPSPVGHFRIHENDGHALISGVRIAPHVPITLWVVLGAPRLLKPRVLVRRVVQHHLHDDPDIPVMCGIEKGLKILDGAVARMHRRVIRDIVSIVFKRRRIERHKPKRADPQLLQISQLLRQSGEVSNSIGIAVIKRADMQLIDNGVFVPEIVVPQRQRWTPPLAFDDDVDFEFYLVALGWRRLAKDAAMERAG